jgi:hypothetical protein
VYYENEEEPPSQTPFKTGTEKQLFKEFREKTSLEKIPPNTQSVFSRTPNSAASWFKNNQRRFSQNHENTYLRKRRQR